MAHRIRLLLVVALAVCATSDSVTAQAAFFTDGRAVSSLNGAHLFLDGGSGKGIQLSVMAGSQAGLSVSYASSSFEQLGLDPFDPEQFEVSTLLFGAFYFLERQSEGGAVTLGTSLSVGRVASQRTRIGLGTDNDAYPVVSFDVSVARALETTDHAFIIVPNANFAFIGLLADGLRGLNPTPSLSGGIGLGVRFTDSAVVSVSPSGIATFGDDLVMDAAVTLGLSVAY